MTPLVFACGGGGGGVSTTTPNAAETGVATRLAVIEVGSAEAMDEVKHVIEERMDAVGVGLEFEGEQDSRLTTRLIGNRSDDFLTRLIETSGFSFRTLVLDGLSTSCTDSNGTEFTVRPGTLVQGRDEAGLATLTCIGPEGQSGDVQWRDTNLNSDLIAAASLITDPSMGELVELTFDDEGGALFQEITGAMVGYPLGMFLGDDLVSAPTVSGEILGGATIVQGLTGDDLPLVLGAASGGMLPTTVRVVSIDAE